MPGANIQIWSVDIDQIDEKKATETLSPQESIRASRLLHAGARRAFVAMRFILRRLLADWLDLAPETVMIALSSYGKPFVKDGPYFSLSHSGNRGLLSLSDKSPIGVDIEVARFDNDVEELIGLSRIAFHQKETDWLISLPVEERGPAFLRVWSRREALLKAAGVGIAVEPDCLLSDVDAKQGGPVFFAPPISYSDIEWRRYAAGGGCLDLLGGESWWVRDLEVDGVIAAIAGVGCLPSDTNLWVEKMELP